MQSRSLFEGKTTELKQFLKSIIILPQNTNKNIAFLFVLSIVLCRTMSETQKTGFLMTQLIFLFCFSEKWSVHFQGLPVASNSISLIEGDMMNLTCFGSTGKTLEALWDIRDRPESVRETISPIGLLSPLGILDNPFIENVTRSYTGNFHCDEAADATDHPRVIHVDVLCK